MKTVRITAPFHHKGKWYFAGDKAEGEAAQSALDHKVGIELNAITKVPEVKRAQEDLEDDHE